MEKSIPTANQITKKWNCREQKIFANKTGAQRSASPMKR
jgi:hypothetical protein